MFVLNKNTYVQYMFFVFTLDLQFHCKKREATGEATGWPLGRPLGGHWEATVPLIRRLVALLVAIPNYGQNLTWTGSSYLPPFSPLVQCCFLRRSRPYEEVRSPPSCGVQH